MRRRLAVLTLALALTGGAQMASRNTKVDVLRVGARLACQCGCKDTVASCTMPSCGFSIPARERIAKAQVAGTPDKDIIDAFLKENGQDMYRASPNAFGWIIPYVSLALGVLAVIWYVKRMFRPKPLPATDPALARYNEQIEKELANLE